MAYQMAMENDKIKVDAVEATEFPDLSTRYSVMAVPKTVINERASVEGAVPETALVEELRQAVGL
ncbi:MAG: thioredoxin family protein [Firmicutes bacterium]|nr:thioredoxin family protein [Bacillota bacterium]